MKQGIAADVNQISMMYKQAHAPDPFMMPCAMPS